MVKSTINLKEKQKISTSRESDNQFLIMLNNKVKF